MVGKESTMGINSKMMNKPKIVCLCGSGRFRAGA